MNLTHQPSCDCPLCRRVTESVDLKSAEQLHFWWSSRQAVLMAELYECGPTALINGFERQYTEATTTREPPTSLWSDREYLGEGESLTSGRWRHEAWPVVELRRAGWRGDEELG